MNFVKAIVAAGLVAASTSAFAADITGAGATFPFPIYSKWFSEYNRKYPSVQINYQSIGSGGGIRQLTAQTVFFGASDGPMTDEQLQAASGHILHFPTVMGAVVMTYNVEGVQTGLKLTPEAIAGKAVAALAEGADVIVAQGTEAGGHGKSGRTTLTLTPAVVDIAGAVPVVAAGGLSDRADREVGPGRARYNRVADSQRF